MSISCTTPSWIEPSLRAADGREVAGDPAVDGDEGGVPRREEELVEVAAQPVAGRDRRDLPVAAVQDHVVARCRRRPAPPCHQVRTGRRGSAGRGSRRRLVEGGRTRRRGRGVDDHGPACTHHLLRRDEHVAGRGGVAFRGVRTVITGPGVGRAGSGSAGPAARAESGLSRRRHSPTRGPRLRGRGRDRGDG